MKISTRFFLLLACSINLVFATAQNQLLADSLKRKLETAPSQEHAAIYNQLAELYISSSPSKAEEYANEALALAQSMKLVRDEARAYKIKSACYSSQSRYKEAINASEKALEVFQKLEDNKTVAEIYNQLGQVYRQKSDFKEAQDNHLKAIEHYRLFRDSAGVATSYNFLGSLFLKQNQYDLALKNYQQSFDMRRFLKDSTGMAALYSNIALVYRDLGNTEEALKNLDKASGIYQSLQKEYEMAGILNLTGGLYFKKNEYQKAIEYYEKALVIREKGSNKAEQAASNLNLGNVYKELNNLPKACEYLKKALSLRKELGDAKNIAIAYNHLGSAYWKAKKYNEALSNYLESLKISMEAGENAETAATYFNIGNIYLELSNYDLALKNFSEALTLSSKIEDKPRMANIYHFMGSTYQKNADYKMALEHFEKSLELRKTLGDQTQIAISLHNIGSVYSDMNNFNQSIRYFSQALDIRKKLSDNVSISISLNSLGNLYAVMNNHSMAFMYFEQALKYATESGYSFNIALCSRKIAELYIAQKNFDKALPFLDNSIKIGIETNNFEILKKGYFALFNLYQSKGDYKAALENYMLSNKYADSINVSMTNKQLLDMQLNYEMANYLSVVNKKTREIAQLKNEKTIADMKDSRGKLIIIVLLISMLLVTSVGILYYNRYQLKHKAAAQLQEKINIIEHTNKQLTRSEEELLQINNTKDKFFSIIAHDIKNPLGGLITITDLVKADFDSLPDKEKKELFEVVNKSSHQLYSLLENLLHWSRSQTGRIAFKPVELRISELVENNFELLKPNADQKNIMTLNMCDPNHKLVADKEMITLVIRNLISNAIKFTRDGGKISVNSVIKDGMAEICVEDNGVGISRTDQQKLFRIDTQYSQNGTRNETGTGLGLILCKEFVQKNGGKIRVESESGAGSKFYISLPIS